MLILAAKPLLFPSMPFKDKHNERERGILQELMNLIGHERRTKRMSKAEVLMISTN